jgi:hypothetical protein
MSNLLNNLKQLTKLSGFLQLAMLTKEMAFLDTEIASERDPYNAWDKDDPKNAGRSREVYCWVVRLAPKLYLHSEGPIKVNGAHNLAYASADLDGVNRWEFDAAVSLAEMLETAKKNAGFTQLAGKEYKDVAAGKAEAYSYLNALLERRADVMAEMKELGLANPEEVFGTNGPQSMAEWNARMNEVNTRAHADETFPDALQALRDMGIISKEDKGTLH